MYFRYRCYKKVLSRIFAFFVFSPWFTDTWLAKKKKIIREKRFILGTCAFAHLELVAFSQATWSFMIRVSFLTLFLQGGSLFSHGLQIQAECQQVALVWDWTWTSEFLCWASESMLADAASSVPLLLYPLWRRAVGAVAECPASLKWRYTPYVGLLAVSHLALV